MAGVGPEERQLLELVALGTSPKTLSDRSVLGERGRATTVQAIVERHRSILARVWAEIIKAVERGEDAPMGNVDRRVRDVVLTELSERVSVICNVGL